jgi:hypothetical protein
MQFIESSLKINNKNVKHFSLNHELLQPKVAIIREQVPGQKIHSKLLLSFVEHKVSFVCFNFASKPKNVKYIRLDM